MEKKNEKRNNLIGQETCLLQSRNITDERETKRKRIRDKTKRNEN